MAPGLRATAQGQEGCVTMRAREAQNIQNPALGAAVLWRFCCGYVEAHPGGEPPRLPLLFLLLPIVFPRSDRRTPAAHPAQLGAAVLRREVRGLASLQAGFTSPGSRACGPLAHAEPPVDRTGRGRTPDPPVRG